MTANSTTDPAPAKIEVTYKVTVEKIIKNFPYRNRDYKEIGTGKDGEADYGYVYYDDNKTVNNTIYEQSLDSVDLPAIIKAVNGLED